ncbi:MAG: hypothetical protein AVDCRST_MAG90-2701, partial [uncultured Microvirga sp.]
MAPLEPCSLGGEQPGHLAGQGAGLREPLFEMRASASGAV